MGTIIANLKPGFTEARAQELTEGTLAPARFVEALVRIAATKTSAIGPDLHVVYVPQGSTGQPTVAVGDSDH